MANGAQSETTVVVPVIVVLEKTTLPRARVEARLDGGAARRVGVCTLG